MEEVKVSLPNLELVDKLQLLINNPDPSLKKSILSKIQEDSMEPFYTNYFCQKLGESPDDVFIAPLKKKNEEEEARLDEKIKDAKENLGDVEVHDALLAKAEFYNRIGAKDKALEAYEVAYKATAGIGGKLDNILTCIRMAFFFDDRALLKAQVDRALKDLAKGGDWERRNKLRVYQGLHFILMRDFKSAALKFLDAVATFTATELMSFSDFVFYCVITSMVALDRQVLRTKLVESPEILSAIGDTPHLKEFLMSYFNCKYADFMTHFVPILAHIKNNRYFSSHLRYFARIMRLNAYRQFLASYQTVTLSAMAQAFGVSESFIDSEVASFISSGKLSCKIDKVGGIIVSNTGDERNDLYLETIKQGDLVLNRIQKLSKVMDL